MAEGKVSQSVPCGLGHPLQLEIVFATTYLLQFT